MKDFQILKNINKHISLTDFEQREFVATLLIRDISKKELILDMEKFAKSYILLNREV